MLRGKEKKDRRCPLCEKEVGGVKVATDLYTREEKGKKDGVKTI